MSSILKLEHASRKLFGEVPVTLVDNVSVEIRKGEFIAITGPSGSGKSSLLYLLGLLDVPTDGKIIVDDIARRGRDQALAGPNIIGHSIPLAA